VRSSEFDGENEVERDEQTDVGVSRPLHVWHRRHFPRLRTVELHEVSYAQQPTDTDRDTETHMHAYIQR